MARDIDNTARLKQAIDSGKGADKTGFPDPAASPLGTDDEAAGTPPSAEAIRHAAAQEIRPSSGKRPGTSDESARTISGEGRGFGSANLGNTVLICLAILVVGGIVMALVA